MCSGAASRIKPILEKVLHEFPSIQMIPSMQMEGVPLAHLVERFASDIAACIVGTTLLFEICDAWDVADSLHREILAYLNGSGADWLALDDDASLFSPDCADFV